MRSLNEFYNRVGSSRIISRQIDELVGLARGLLADGTIDEVEVQCLHAWLAANASISGQPLIRTLYKRVHDVLKDSTVDADEKKELFETLNHFVNSEIEVGETLKSTSLPLNNPAPDLAFLNTRYCFTGTFTYGQRKECENAILTRGGTVGSLTKKTSILVVGTYATDSWKHSSFGNKIIQACEWRDCGVPIAIVSEVHWVKYL